MPELPQTRPAKASLPAARNTHLTAHPAGPFVAARLQPSGGGQVSAGAREP